MPRKQLAVTKTSPRHAESGDRVGREERLSPPLRQKTKTTVRWRMRKLSHSRLGSEADPVDRGKHHLPSMMRKTKAPQIQLAEMTTMNSLHPESEVDLGDRGELLFPAIRQMIKAGRIQPVAMTMKSPHLESAEDVVDRGQHL
jgi:hypothetical protein